jgi:hypothetical protein
MNKDQTDVSHLDKGEINEPVAIRYDFDGNGYLYMDAGSGSDWASRVKDCEFLYTHPMLELTDEEIIKVYEDMFGVALARSCAIEYARAIIKASRGEK